MDASTWIPSVIGLLHAATRQLPHDAAAKTAIEQATSLLQEQMRFEARRAGGLLPWRARKVLEYIDAHLSGPVRVSDLSAVARLSEAHFSRSFKRAMGVSPHTFVLRRRVDLAARLMLQSPASLAEIALCCGFTDQSHLCNQFRKRTGESPARWRRAHRGESGRKQGVSDRQYRPLAGGSFVGI
jgi:AraC family transcriptional regulator